MCVLGAPAVKSTVRGRRDARGVAGDKRVNGVKFHVACDTDGRVLSCCVSAVNDHGCPRAEEVAIDLGLRGYDRARVALADAGYRGQEPWSAVEGFELRAGT